MAPGVDPAEPDGSAESGIATKPSGQWKQLSVANEVFRAGALRVELDPTAPGPPTDSRWNEALTIAPTSVLDLQFLGPLDDASYVIASFAPLTGAWTPDNVRNLPVRYVIDCAFGQTAQQIAIAAVPEPGTLTALAAVAALLASPRHGTARPRSPGRELS